MLMKKYLNIILAVAASALLFSCTENEPDGSQYAESPAIEIVSKNVVFAPAGGTGSIEVNAPGKVYASSERSWLDVSVSGQTISLVAAENESLESRYATITIVSGESSATVTAQQFGITSDLVWDESYNVGYNGGDVTLQFTESGFVRVSVTEGKDWISVDVADNELIITAAPNAYKTPREGSVSFSAGGKVREVGIVQAGNPSGLNPGDPEPREFTVQEAWTPKYVGLSETDETKAIVGVDAEEGSAAGRWFIKVVPVAEYNAVGSQYTYLNLNARKWASENPVICKDSDTVEIDALAFGDYFIYAIGVNNHGEINYTYAVEAVTITKVLSPYEKFLGTWSFPRGDSADTWTVTENVPDKSYYITGIDGKTEIKVPADFNAADGTIVVKTNTNLGKSTVNTAEGELTGDAQILGKIDYNGTIYRINGNYTIFTVKINADASKADLVPGTVNITSLGGEFTLAGFAIYTMVGESAYALTQGSTLPNTITHLTQGSGSGGGNGGGGGGGNGGGGDTSGYNAWLGSWNVSGVTLTISQKTAGSTYTVSGLEGYDFEARYADGKIEFFYQVIATSGTSQLCLFGMDDDGDGYIVEGDPKNDGLLATATLSTSGTSANLVGAKYEAVYSGVTYQENIVALLLLVYDSSDDGLHYASDDPKQIDMPTTMTKASGSSVSVKSTRSIDLVKGLSATAEQSFTAAAKAQKSKR